MSGNEILSALRRSCHVVGYLGTNQMGKTHLMEEHAEKWQALNPDCRILRVGKWAQDKGGVWVRGADQDPKLLFPYIDKVTNFGEGPQRPTPANPNYVNPLVGLDGALIQFDDLDGFLPQRVKGTPYNSLFMENAHLRLDVQFTAHRPQTIDKNVLNACHYLYVFSMGENYAREYIESMPELRGSEVVRRNLFPRKRGQYVVIRNDPATHVPVGADFVDGYRPELDEAA